MSDPINFEFYRFTKVASADLAAYLEPLRQDLARLQSVDVSKLNGRELRKLRDRILRSKWMLLVCDPKMREQIIEKMGDRLPSATFEEILANAPEPPTVKFF
jgi:hypothetical protein